MQIHQEFELLGLNLEEVKFRVLEAIAIAGKKTTSNVSFDDLNQVLTDLRQGKKTAKPQIYRYITDLEEFGLISVDRSEYRNKYKTNTQLITASLIERKAVVKKEMQEKLEEIRQQKKVLSDISLSRLAKEFSLLLTGKEIEEQPKVIEGVAAIQDIIDSSIYQVADSGDVIRVTLDWVNVPKNVEFERQRIGIDLLEKGIQFKMMYRLQSQPNPELIKIRKERYQEIKDDFGTISLKQSEKTTKGYNGVALNREGVVLVVSENPLTALYVPSSENAELVNSFVDAFDTEFKNAKNVLDTERDTDG